MPQSREFPLLWAHQRQVGPGCVKLSQCIKRNCWDWSTAAGHGTESARGAALYEAAETLRRPVRWACGVTTVGMAAGEWAAAGFQRTDQTGRRELLTRTLGSLKQAGFGEPRLFVDGALEGFGHHGLHVTYRWPAVLTWGNWLLSLQELVIRDPEADLYAIFQDDMVTAANLRAYLETQPVPERGYWNLYSCALTEPRLEPWIGWHPTPTIATDGNVVLQAGLGAVALVLPRAAARALLGSPWTAGKAFADTPEIRYKKADGGIVNALNHAGFRELVHLPSLVQHTGDVSSMGNGAWPPAATFPGESFDLLELLL